jgi:D-3-phosphoglycerate dehydrogenase
LAAAIESGHVGGAALDVFASEPCTDSPLFSLPSVVVTPHLGASTEEAQDKAGEQIAEQVLLALAGDFVPYAVNVAARSASAAVRPYLSLAERLGHVIAALCEGLPDSLEVSVQGALHGEDLGILTLAALKGVLSAGSDEPVSYVNAPRLAEQRGLAVRETATAAQLEYVNLLTLRSGQHAVSGTLVGRGPTERIVMIDDHGVELPFAENLLVVRNDDRPGMIGAVGLACGEAGVSISSMAVGQTGGEASTALMLLATDSPVPDDVIRMLRATDGIMDVHRVHGRA